MATLNIFGAVLVLIGSVWFLQGINVLPGSFMTGQIRWRCTGGLCCCWLPTDGGTARARASDIPGALVESLSLRQTKNGERVNE